MLMCVCLCGTKCSRAVNLHISRSESSHSIKIRVIQSEPKILCLVDAVVAIVAEMPHGIPCMPFTDNVNGRWSHIMKSINSACCVVCDENFRESCSAPWLNAGK